MEKAEQHTIPKSYLKAWCDPATPNGAFIWVFPRQAGQGERRSPRSTFAQEDFYTLPGASGERDLSVENALGVIEGAFVGVRDGALRQQRPLSGTEKDDLCAFVASMLTRTTRFTDHHRSQWSEILRKIEHVEKASPGAKARWAGVLSGTSAPTGIDDVRAMVAFTAQGNVTQMVPILAPLLAAMRLTIMETMSTPGFITSDAPCVWSDPLARLMPWPLDGLGLGSPTIEVMMPISPQQTALLTWHISEGYRTINDDLVMEVNRCLRGDCHRSFVVAREVTNPGWFEPLPPIFRKA